MSRLRIFSFFGDCAIQDYRAPTFDYNNPGLDLSREPVKQTSEIKVSSLNEAFAFLESTFNREKTPCFGLFECEKIKIGFHLGGAIRGMSLYSPESDLKQCDFSNLITAIKSAPKAPSGEFTLHALLGRDQVMETKVENLDDTEDYFREFQHLIAEGCSDTGVIPSLSVIAELEGAAWIKTCDHERSVLLNQPLENAISFLKGRKSTLN